MQYQLLSVVKNTLEIKKSLFITWLVPIKDRQEAMAWLAQSKQDYPDARHHCFAYIMGDSPSSQSAAMSDDGEPSGTAGKPMLNVLQHKPISNTLAIVIRYFGGIKLGAGGLVRAYSQAVEQAYQVAESQQQLVEIIPMTLMSVTVGFAEEQWLRHQINVVNGQIIDVAYSENVEVMIKIADSNVVTVRQALTARSIEFKVVEE